MKTTHSIYLNKIKITDLLKNFHIRYVTPQFGIALLRTDWHNMQKLQTGQISILNKDASRYFSEPNYD